MDQHNIVNYSCDPVSMLEEMDKQDNFTDTPDLEIIFPPTEVEKPPKENEVTNYFPQLNHCYGSATAPPNIFGNNCPEVVGSTFTTMDNITQEDDEEDVTILTKLDEEDGFTDTPEIEVIVSLTKEYKVPTEADLQRVCEESTLYDKELAFKILKWALTPIPQIPEINNRSGFRNLKGNTKNQTILKTVQLLAVFMYGYGDMNAVPRNKDEKRIIDYRSKLPKKFVYWRARRFVRFLSKNSGFFKDTQMYSGELRLLYGNLYDLLDGYKTLIKKEGLFDPSLSQTHHTKNCGGMFWEHYYKINQVVDCLRDVALESRLRLISPKNQQVFLNNHGILYDTEEVLMAKALEVRVSMLGRTATKPPRAGQSTPKKRSTPAKQLPTKRSKVDEENRIPGNHNL